MGVCAFDDLTLALGWQAHVGFLGRLWYQTVLPGVATLFCAYFCLKARFIVVQILALLTAVGMGSRVFMTWNPPIHGIRYIAALRLLISGAFAFVIWWFDRGFRAQSGAERTNNKTVSDTRQRVGVNG